MNKNPQIFKLSAAKRPGLFWSSIWQPDVWCTERRQAGCSCAHHLAHAGRAELCGGSLQIHARSGPSNNTSAGQAQGRRPQGAVQALGTNMHTNLRSVQMSCKTHHISTILDKNKVNGLKIKKSRPTHLLIKNCQE